jgi:hypothetical protein
MYKLNKREKLLIYICLLLAVAIGGLYALILPAAEAAMTLKQELAERQMTVAEADNQIALYPQLKVEVNKLEAEVAEIEEQFYAYTDNERLDAMITTLLLKYQLTPLMLTLADTISTPVAPYQPGVAADTEGSGETQTDGAAISGPVILSNTIHVEASGNEARILAFLAELETMPYARLASLNIAVDDTISPVAPAVVSFDDPILPASSGRELYAVLTADIVVYLY